MQVISRITFLLAAGAVIGATALAACGEAARSTPTPSAVLASPAAPRLTPTPSPVPTVGPAKAIAPLLDVTTSYKRQNLEQGAQQVANWIAELVRSGQAAVDIYPEVIAADSYVAKNSLEPFHVDRIEPQLPSPTPLPTFTPRATATPLPPPQLFANPTTKASATAAAQKAAANDDAQRDTDVADQAAAQATPMKAWQDREDRRLKALDEAGRRAEAYAKVLRERVGKLPADNTATNIGEAIARSGRRLQGGRGQKYLVIVSDMKPDGKQTPIPPGALNGVVVIVIWWQCDDPANVCDQREASWKEELGNAGALRVDFYDLSQSEVLRNPLL